MSRPNCSPVLFHFPRMPWLYAFVATVALVSFSKGRAALPPDVSTAVEWYDTLGFPDTKDLPYVRVSTGSWSQSSGETRKDTFQEGFLVNKDADSFTVFICNLPDLDDVRAWDPFSEPYAPLTTVRFVRKNTGPKYSRVGYEVLDFKATAAGILKRLQAHMQKQPFGGIHEGRLTLEPPVRIFAIGRACLEKGLTDTGLALIQAATPHKHDNNVKPTLLRDELQQEMGDAIALKAEMECGDPSKTWAELLENYENFEARFPACGKIPYAKESAAILRTMVAEEKAHQAKPVELKTPEERIAEDIYQLRNFQDEIALPLKGRPNPLGRLVNAGFDAVPQLIAALDDKRFTHSVTKGFYDSYNPPRDIKVGEMALLILEDISGRNFHPDRHSDGKAAKSPREKAQAWWADVQKKGEKEVLAEIVSAGGEDGVGSAVKLADQYPADALKPIEAAVAATQNDDFRADYLEAAGKLKGDDLVTFLKTQLDPGNGLYSQVAAAKALNAQGNADAVPAMIKAWHAVQASLPAKDPGLDHNSEVFRQVAGLIEFLATSGSTDAIDAMRFEMPKAPAYVQLGVLREFLPLPAPDAGIASVFLDAISTNGGIPKLPGGAAGTAVERLLVSTLGDTSKGSATVQIENTFYKNPRVCDVAALVLSQRWPHKYAFRWTPSEAQRDAQIAKLRALPSPKD